MTFASPPNLGSGEYIVSRQSMSYNSEDLETEEARKEINKYSESQFVFDDTINPHIRFP